MTNVVRLRKPQPKHTLADEVGHLRMVVDVLTTIVLGHDDYIDATAPVVLTPNCLTPKFAAYILERNRKTVYRWAVNGWIESMPNADGGHVIINRDTLVDKLRGRLPPDQLKRIAARVAEHKRLSGA